MARLYVGTGFTINGKVLTQMSLNPPCLNYFVFPVPCSLFPVPCSLTNDSTIKQTVVENSPPESLRSHPTRYTESNPCNRPTWRMVCNDPNAWRKL
ncbi:MAG: hypothetical protein RIE73_24465 [Coleofasciculus sp. C1-SOL-03]